MPASAVAFDPERLPQDTGPVPNPLPRLLSGEDLSEEDSRHLFDRLVLGQLTEAETASLLIALRMKGETAAEMAGAARALAEAAVPFARPDYLYADCCGTGGDGAGSINVSTAAALVAAACGLAVAKHGNRSVSSRCGSADVLEALGVRLEVPPEVARAALDATGFCFLYAPAYHPGMRHAASVRRQLQVRTVMNLLGPCVNPARPPIQLLGVAEERLLEPVAATLGALGMRRALVVHGGGLDEVALHADTQAVRLFDGAVTREMLTPELAGLARRPLASIEGGAADENGRRLRALIEGQGAEANRDIVALNAGALLWTAGRAATLADGTALAAAALSAGRAARVLDTYVEMVA